MVTDSATLRAKIKERGLKMTFIAQQIGVTLSTLSRKISGRAGFTQKEIKIIAQILGLSDKETCSIFLA
jgi:transcriptional regulator with XRE-family HTH domain